MHSNVPSQFTGKTTRVKDPRVVIIGGGASGIAAATCLVEMGFTDVTVLEAEGRLGGRIHSVPFGDNYADLGAHWVHGEDGNVVYQLASQYNLIKPSGDFEKVHFICDDTVEIDPDMGTELWAETQLFLQDARSMEKFKGSLVDYILPRCLETGQEKIKDEKLLNAFADWLIKFQCTIEGCDYLSDVSTEGLLHYKSCPGDSILCWREKGYYSIIDLLLKKYPSRDSGKDLPIKTFLNTEVDQIDWSGLTAFVKCTNGQMYEADHVIVTVSLGVLKERHGTLFSPPLPDRKITAIRGLGIGTVNKIYLKFPHQWWPEDCSGFSFLRKEPETPPTKGEFNWERGLLGFYTESTAPRILGGWLIGDTARDAETYSDEDIVEGCMRVLDKFLGHKYSIPKPESMIRSKWFSNPHFRGSYSHRNINAEILKTSAFHLSEPLQNFYKKEIVLFAGEATHSYYFSTVHGAIETGWREALRLAAIYQKSSKM